MVSEKQANILRKNGFNDSQINTMSYADVQAKIGEIINKPKETLHVASYEDFNNKPKAEKGSSYWVAYAKDIFVALRPNRPETDLALMAVAVACVKFAKQEFEK